MTCAATALFGRWPLEQPTPNAGSQLLRLDVAGKVFVSGGSMSEVKTPDSATPEPLRKYQDQIVGAESWTHDELVLALQDLAKGADRHLADLAEEKLWNALRQERIEAHERMEKALHARIAALDPQRPFNVINHRQPK